MGFKYEFLHFLWFNVGVQEFIFKVRKEVSDILKVSGQFILFFRLCNSMNLIGPSNRTTKSNQKTKTIQRKSESRTLIHFETQPGDLIPVVLSMLSFHYNWYSSKIELANQRLGQSASSDEDRESRGPAPRSFKVSETYFQTLRRLNNHKRFRCFVARTNCTCKSLNP